MYVSKENQVVQEVRSYETNLRRAYRQNKIGKKRYLKTYIQLNILLQDGLIYLMKRHLIILFIHFMTSRLYKRRDVMQNTFHLKNMMEKSMLFYL